MWLPYCYSSIFRDVGGDDRCEMYLHRARRAAPPCEAQSDGQAAAASTQPAPETADDVTTVPATTLQTRASIDDESSLHSYRSRPSDSESEGEDEDDFLDMDPFGLDDDGTCYPVVELSTDLPGQLTQDDIPDALEFSKQCQALSAYVLPLLSVVL